MKSAYYTAVVTNAYRMAMDAYDRDKENYTFDESLMRELESVSHRDYCTGYYLDLPADEAQLASSTGYIREKAYFATAIEQVSSPEGVEKANDAGGLYRFIQRNKVSVGVTAEIISPGRIGRAFTVTELYSESGEPIQSAPHPAQIFWVRVPFEVSEGDIMRSGEN